MGGGDEAERRMGSMICPKPRRLGLLNPSINDSIRPSRWPANNQPRDFGDSKAGTELLDIILTKGGYDREKSAALSPPYFCGSPPARALNPVIQDCQFGKEKLMVGDCVRGLAFGHKPAPVRIEGFDCLSSISAVA